MNFQKKLLDFRLLFYFLCRFLLEKQTEMRPNKQTEMWPKVIIKDPTYHPQPKRGFRAVQMGQNMTQNGDKNSLKQPPQKRKEKKDQHLVPFISVEIPLITICASI
jgi:hypothetical protein